MRPAAVSIDVVNESAEKESARKEAIGHRAARPLPRLTTSLPKRRSWWPFRRAEPDIALRLLAVHMDHATPRR